MGAGSTFDCHGCDGVGHASYISYVVCVRVRVCVCVCVRVCNNVRLSMERESRTWSLTLCPRTQVALPCALSRWTLR